MSKKFLRKCIYACMLGLLAVSAVACCCDDRPTRSSCTSRVNQDVNNFNTSYAKTDIVFEKSADVEYLSEAGQIINYTYSVTNNGPEDLDRLQVEDDKIDVSCPAITGYAVSLRNRWLEF